MQNFKELISIAKFGKIADLEELIDQGANLNQRDQDGKSILGLVCEIGRIDNAKILIEKGATFVNYNEKLMTSACGNIGLFVMEALDEGAMVNYVRDFQNETPLMIAADQGSLSALKILIDNGAELEARNEFGMSALYIAAWLGQPDCLLYLINAGGNINTLDNWKNTPIAAVCEIEPKWEYAINTLSDERIRALEILLEKGADPNTKNDEGLTPLDLANQNYHINAANLLKCYNAQKGQYL